jgi:hypothetical protein
MAPPILPIKLRERTVIPRTTPRCLMIRYPGRSLVVVTIMAACAGPDLMTITPQAAGQGVVISRADVMRGP